MAGFFRTRGSLFFDFAGTKDITFDDGATADLATYTQAWRAPAGSSRTWDVGYVRSVDDDTHNDYGESMEDLHALLRRAPEVKRCLVRRLFEYVVDEDQTIDAGYLNYLADQFTQRSKTNSSDAFKWTVSQLMLSQSFQQSDPDPSQCYDYPPGFNPAGSPPCRVSYILHQNCAMCHGAGGAGGLNLDAWITLPDGSKAFPHFGADGKQIPLAETLSEMVMRLSSSDPNVRMPFYRYMNPIDRQELFQWAQGQK
jgi:hypothetical protein